MDRADLVFCILFGIAFVVAMVFGMWYSLPILLLSIIAATIVAFFQDRKILNKKLNNLPTKELEEAVNKLDEAIEKHNPRDTLEITQSELDSSGEVSKSKTSIRRV
jgi:uncharacterized membrane protein YdjX (TVP38/TMEM64 family)